MALRRPHRSIETFDIALMAVVTKAMGAFLILMLLMIPSYVAIPRLESGVSEAKEKREALEKQVAALERRQTELKSFQQAKARLSELESENRELRAPSLLVSLSWADCNASDIEFYVHGENVKLPNGRDWPAVRRGSQDAPPGVVEHRSRPGAIQAVHFTAALGAIGLATNHAPHQEMIAQIRGRMAKQSLWRISKVPPNAKIAFYAKIGQLHAPCEVTGNALLTAPEKGRVFSSPIAYARLSGTVKASGQILLMTHLTWTGDEFIRKTLTPADQDAVDRKFGFN